MSERVDVTRWSCDGMMVTENYGDDSFVVVDQSEFEQGTYTLAEVRALHKILDQIIDEHDNRGDA